MPTSSKRSGPPLALVTLGLLSKYRTCVGVSRAERIKAPGEIPTPRIAERSPLGETVETESGQFRMMISGAIRTDTINSRETAVALPQEAIGKLLGPKLLPPVVMKHAPKTSTSTGLSKRRTRNGGKTPHRQPMGLVEKDFSKRTRQAPLGIVTRSQSHLHGRPTFLYT